MNTNRARSGHDYSEMNKTSAAILTGIAAAAIGGSLLLTQSPSPANTNQAVTSITPPAKALTPFTGKCDPALWQHVYHGRFKTAQDRLKVIQPCITVTGTLFSSKEEADGDRHIRVTVDPQFANLLNDKNMSDQQGKLVIEPICQSEPSQSDTIKSGVCKGWRQNIVIPPMGTRVSITGSLVLDEEHLWVEQHPISHLEIIK